MFQANLFPENHQGKQPYRVHSKGIHLFLKVTPKAAKSRLGEIVPVGDHDALKVYVQAVAEKGQANQEVIRFLSRLWRIPQQNFHLVAGQTSRYKTLLLQDIPEEYLKKCLELFS